MSENSEISKCLNKINDLIMRYRIEYINEPKYLILPIEHRQAIRIIYSESIGKNLWDIPDIVNYYDIPIIKKEEVVIV